MISVGRWAGAGVGLQHRAALAGVLVAAGEARGVVTQDVVLVDGLWRRQIPQLSEFLLAAHPGDEVVGEAGWVGGFGLRGDLVVVLEFVDQHGRWVSDGAASAGSG